MQLREVGRPALGQVDVRLGGHPMGTVDSPINAASGICSPPSTTIGLPAARNRANPVHRSFGDPSSRTTIRSQASSAADNSVVALLGFAHR